MCGGAGVVCVYVWWRGVVCKEYNTTFYILLLGFRAYIFVVIDLVKRGVLTLVGEVRL